MKNILLVDDEQDLRNVIAEILERAGYAVISAPDAESALSVLLNRTRIDLVITDLRLPGMSGSEFVGVLRKALPGVPVIMLTAFGSIESYVESRSMGVFEYINKPVHAWELRRIVKIALHEPAASYTACQTSREVLPSSWDS